MYLMYVDESGDCGLPCQGSPTRYFILSGLVIHELRWKDTLEQLIDFRKRMKSTFKLRMRDEIHASAMMSMHDDELMNIQRNDRLTILRHFINEIANLADVNIINVVVDKSNKPVDFNVFEVAWRNLLQRFENTIRHKNFPGPSNPDDRGVLFPDHTDDKKLKILLRKMRKYNPIPNRSDYEPGYRNMPITMVIEDPNMRSSRESYFIQAVDCVAYFLKQQIDPSSYLRKKSGHQYFAKLDSVLCKHANRKDKSGIVWI